MNNNSYICKFIAEHANWNELLEQKHITVKYDDNLPDLAIFNYGIEADFTDPVVQEARGIIIDLNNLEVVCWPFRKFGNYSESYADTIDWSTARVQDKVDGSIMKLWYYNGNWRISTNGMIDADKANTASVIHKTFAALFLSADNYNDIKFNELNKDYTYIFELVSPENQIVIKYDNIHLYHIGTRDNKTGKEYNVDIGIEKPVEYSINSTTYNLQSCIDLVNKINQGQDSVKYEGFVVVDDNWNRIKIKSPEYLHIHSILGNRTITKKTILTLIKESDSTVLNKFIEDYPIYEVYVNYYRFKISELKLDILNIQRLALSLYEEYSHDRGAVAKDISKYKLAPFGFKALDGKMITVDELTIPQLEKYIDEYEYKIRKDL